MDVQFDIEALETESQRAIAQVWAETLSVSLDLIGRNTSFFQLGGDSVSAVKAVSRCRKLGFEISVAQLISLQTVRRCAEILDLKQEPAITVWPDVFVRCVLLKFSNLNQAAFIYKLLLL
jgi:aryl carrier-like protein